MWTLIIFTRWPIAGETKTRLIPVYGTEGAERIHRQLIARTASAASGLSGKANIVTAIADAPRDAAVDSLFARDWPAIAQRGEHLGERMANAITDAFSLHPDTEATVLVGVDCPDYSAALFRDAAMLLEANDIVFAPTEDGGYGLVGMRRSAWESRLRHALFDGIEWGTSQVMTASLARVAALSPLPTTLLMPTIWDVDTPNDAARAVAEGAIEG